MLMLRPTCEHCNKLLPPNSTEAMICTYECTFCSECVELLENVCPNCGGGFCTRPNRPAEIYKNNCSLDRHPASKEKVHKPVNLTQHTLFARDIRDISPENR
jgi:hypothetical protein